MLTMAELVWECVIISLVLLFGINIGLAIGLTEIRKKEALALSISYGLIILIIGILANFLNDLLYSTINYCIFIILGIIGAVTILSGIYTIKRFKKSKKNSFSSPALLSSSICYFAGFTATAVLLSREITMSFLEFNIFMALAAILAIIGLYSFSKVLKHAETPYPILLGNFMILNGFYFLICAAFIPNIAKLSSVQSSALQINTDLSSLIFLIMAFAGVILLGSYLQGEKITKLGDIYQKISLSTSNKTKRNKQSK
jgi:predicted transporter